MRWSELQPQVRAAIAVAVTVLVVVLIWNWFVSPMRQRYASSSGELERIEAQIEQIEREVESVPPPSAGEQESWQVSLDTLVSRLGPESELPILLESLTRLSEAQGVDLFITSAGAGSFAGQEANDFTPLTQRVMRAVPGSRFVPLDCQMYGDYAAIGRFVSQVGRLGWLVEIQQLTIARQFPEVSAQARLMVLFRAVAAESANAGRGAVGGR